MYAVGCTMTTVRTNLSCDIELGVKIKEKNGWKPFWKTIGGRLDLGEDEGVWFNYYVENERVGIVLFPQAVRYAGGIGVRDKFYFHCSACPSVFRKDWNAANRGAAKANSIAPSNHSTGECGFRAPES